MKNENTSWIWLPKSLYPHNQSTKFDALSGGDSSSYTVAEFQRLYDFGKEISSVTASFSADTEIQLFANGKCIATGPAPAGGDFLGNGKPRERYYKSELTFSADGKALELFARVKMCPTRICEYSRGRGGFTLSATVFFSDGSTAEISTDESWLVRKRGAYVSACVYDGRIKPDPFVNAESVPDVWQATLAPIPVREETEIAIASITLAPHECRTERITLDMIRAGFVHLLSRGDGQTEVRLTMRETENPDEHATTESALLCSADEYRSFHLDSIGCVTAELKNLGDSEMTVDLSLISTHYPITEDAVTVTDDEEVNEILKVCKHTLKYCRQLHHLDSPRHCEPLACTGDYYIEALMTAFSFGDMRLAKFDVERTAELLRHNGGRMFHTTYSLIWVKMLWDVYMFSGERDMLIGCRDALDILLSRFDGYIGNNGLIDNPPDYMFVDWIYIDGISLHHPPKALGQTVLNMFYYLALDHAERIYNKLDDKTRAEACCTKRMALKTAVNTLLYDAERGMYFEGLNTPTAPDKINEWMPENTEKRYYLKHSNIMAAYTSICDTETAQMLIEKVMNEEIEANVQPYFLHYLFEAIFTHGLREKYTLELIERWKKPVKECGKGLAEGFYPPEPTYNFDHSHAWGGTPLCSLPKALLGISVEEAGYKRISISPALLGLKSAHVEIPTPYGMIVCDLAEGKDPVITAPPEVEITWN